MNHLQDKLHVAKTQHKSRFL